MEEGQESPAEAVLTPQRVTKSSLFEDYRPEDVRELIRDYPLAWVCAQGGGAGTASLLPLIGEYDEAGTLTHLVGHLSRQNPLYPALLADVRALILFTGPHAYVSPADVADRAWAPTWNYAQARVEAEVDFEPPCTEEALTILVEAMESRRDNPWGAGELGSRYADMVTRIIGFRARVTRVLGRFKLGQDEDPEIRKTMIANSSDPAMRHWLGRFGPKGGRNG